jgi:hypothetical protein
MPAVDLRAGASAENPPCPACGDPLFGWAMLRPDRTPVRRCETCGLGLIGEATTPEEARSALEELGRSAGRTPNRASLQAWIGQSGWASLSGEQRFLFTPDSIQRLGHGKTRSRPGIAAMWQTLINAFTFGHNVALGRLGRARSIEASEGWQRSLDLGISVLATPLLIIVAVPLELFASAAGRGGELELSP